MKSLYYLAAVATLGLASCTSQEDVISAPEQQEIGFQTVVGKSTRSVIKSTEIPNGTSIYVASAYQSIADDNYANYFPEEFMKFTGKGGTWNFDPIPSSSSSYRYYPVGGVEMDFLAYYSEGKTPNTATATRGGSLNRFDNLTLAFDATGDNALDGNTEVLYGNGEVTSFPKTGTTHIKFYHALAWISVKMNVTEDIMKIYDLTLDGVDLSGTMSVDVSDSHVFGTPEWTLSGTPTNKEFATYHKPAGVSPSEMTEDNMEGVLVPTQKQTKLTLTFAMNSTPNAKTTREINLNPDNLDGLKWEAGKHYTYVLNYAMNDISFTCEVENYNNLPTDPNDKNYQFGM